MEEPVNLRAFNYLALKIFDQLYESFPEKIELEGMDFALDIVLGEDHKAVNDQFYMMFSETIEWLQEEGFLRYDTAASSGTYYGARLTLRGLTVLGYTPTSISGDQPQTIIGRAKNIIASGTENAATDMVKGVVSSALNAMAQTSG